MCVSFLLLSNSPASGFVYRVVRRLEVRLEFSVRICYVTIRERDASFRCSGIYTVSAECLTRVDSYVFIRPTRREGHHARTITTLIIIANRVIYCSRKRRTRRTRTVAARRRVAENSERTHAYGKFNNGNVMDVYY